jgi:hypothetical protein
MTFEDLNPFLKGFYLTLNSWRPGRDQEGWRVNYNSRDMDFSLHLDDDENPLIISEFGSENRNLEGTPKLVTACPRFKSDVGAIASILRPEIPPVINLRPQKIITVVHGFGDASGSGLGSTFTCGSGFTYQIGVWGLQNCDGFGGGGHGRSYF